MIKNVKQYLGLCIAMQIPASVHVVKVSVGRKLHSRNKKKLGYLSQ